MTISELELTYLTQNPCFKLLHNPVPHPQSHLGSSPRSPAGLKTENQTELRTGSRRFCIFHVLFPLATLQLARVGKLCIPLSWYVQHPSNPWKSVSKGLLWLTPTACNSHSSGSTRSGDLSSRSSIPCPPSIHPKSTLRCLVWWQKSSCVAARKSIWWWILQVIAPALSPGSPSDSYYCCNKFFSKTNRHAVNLLVWALCVT